MKRGKNSSPGRGGGPPSTARWWRGPPPSALTGRHLPVPGRIWSSPTSTPPTSAKSTPSSLRHARNRRSQNENGVGVYVHKLSSYQIDLPQSLDCDVAVLLNITPDHLDRYESFEAYRDSKLRLFHMQAPSEPFHKAVLGEMLPARCGGLHELVPNNVLLFALDLSDRQSEWPALQGPHNLQNAACAVAVIEALGIGRAAELGVRDEVVAQGLRTYPGLPHRMERIRERDGVTFVNDSKATNPTATAPALAAFERIRWICGGQAKTDNLDECAPYFGHVRKAYTIGKASELFANLLSPHMSVAKCDTLERAVGEAASEAEAGDTV